MRIRIWKEINHKRFFIFLLYRKCIIKIEEQFENDKNLIYIEASVFLM